MPPDNDAEVLAALAAAEAEANNAPEAPVAVPEVEAQKWEEPYPTEGKVRVQFVTDASIHNGLRVVPVKVGDVVIIDAAQAQSLHRVIKGV